MRGKLLGGWQLSGLVQAQAGQWLTPTISTATGTRRPDLVGKPNYLDPRVVRTLTGFLNQPVTGNFFFDPTPGLAFAAPPAGRYGTSGPAVIRGPGRHNWDLSLFKNIKANERITVQIVTASEIAHQR